MSPEEHWKHFEKAWVALKSYTYLGKGTPVLDLGVDRETMPLRHDMRNSTGGITAAPLCIVAPEPYWRDDECVPAHSSSPRSRTGATTNAFPRRSRCRMTSSIPDTTWRASRYCVR
jgi:hypothetical protein